MSTLSQNTNRDLQKSTDKLLDVMQDVLLRASRRGATEAAVVTNHDCGFSVGVRMGEVETIEFNEDKGVGVTVYIGQRQGSASSSDTSPEALDSMVSAAYEIAEVSAEDPCFGLPDKDLIAHEYPDLDLLYPWAISPEEAIKQAIACEHYALGQDKRITNSNGVHVSTHTFSQGYANSYGCLSLLQASDHSISCSLVAGKGEGMQRDHDYTRARLPTELLSLEQLAINTANRTLERLKPKKIKTQKVPVLFSSRVSSGLLSALIGAISGSNLYRKNSFLLDSVGQQLFPNGISIYEQPHLLRALGSAPVDSEGVPTRANRLIEDGRLCQYVLSSYSARRLGLKTTANAGGVFNLTMDATAGSLQELLQTLDKGLLVTGLMGRGVNLLTGDYSQGVIGFWVEHGQIQYPVEELTVAGNLKDMFKQIVAVGSDINPNISTRCGSILIDRLMVAGS